MEQHNNNTHIQQYTFTQNVQQYDVYIHKTHTIQQHSNTRKDNSITHNIYITTYIIIHITTTYTHSTIVIIHISIHYNIRICTQPHKHTHIYTTATTRTTTLIHNNRIT